MIAIWFDCSRIKAKGKELKTITTTADIRIQHRYNPEHQIEIIEADNYDTKTAWLILL
ncbi:MAG: hypothetical protein WBE34_01250 [Candidatus Nitrosopolaris sp.]